MKVDLLEIRRRTTDVNNYISGISEPFREKFLERKKEYKLKASVVGGLKNYAKNYVIVAFSAE